MPDVDLQDQVEQVGRDRRGRFRKGRSGNPIGRTRGIPNPTTRAALLLLDGEAEGLTRKAVELALAGDAAALRLCLDRVLAPRRGRPVELALPPIDSAADLVSAMAAVVAAAASGAITPDEALTLSQMANSFIPTLAAREEERRRQRHAEFYAKSAKPGPG
ncbi:MAG TPA: DUF5681 domain-containing protein [Stellaceae bacterium]